MHLKTRTWFVISLLCFILAGFFWHLGNERYRRDMLTNPTNEPVTAIKELGAHNFRHAPPLLSPMPSLTTVAPTNGTNLARSNPLLTNRLSNTSKPLKQLMRSDSAVLLRNALIDTSVTDGLPIPDHLRAGAGPGSYVVQSRGPLTDAFRARLKSAGATIISYIPNNAYLVRVSEAGANQMRAFPKTQSVLPWEPYYKLDLRLLALAVENQPLPPDAKLNVLLFPGQREAGLKSVRDLGATILGEDRSPFGHELVIQAPPGILTALAAMPLVQGIEVHHPRQLVNDLTRPRIGVATNSTTSSNYLGLTGEGVLVNINDTGVDSDHPDLASRVFGDTLAATQDDDGHGTHVAGTIAGNGSMSSSVMKTPHGSSTNLLDFRGMAPMAKLFSMPIDLLIGPVISDTYLQETAARTNAFISNNSWGYVDSLEYDFSAASFDAAARDAIPSQPGPEPLLFVFAAGNSGGGSADGKGGQSESIASPATSKNSITVGSIEKARFITITNFVIDGTNATRTDFYPSTDSDNQVTYFSSRGNVGVGVEGEAGRFKPDLVAPGSFVISCRSDQWTDPTPSGGVIFDRRRREIIKPARTNLYDIVIPANGIQLTILTRSNMLSPSPFPALDIYARAGAPPNLGTDFQGSRNASFPVTPGLWYFAISNPSPTTVNFDLITIISLNNTNAADSSLLLSNLNYELRPYYRYESGTSQSAPAVSGTLALLQQFFETKLNLTKDENWPALMKAILINGSRSMSGYNRQVKTDLNLQGWGVVNLTNSLPGAMNSGPNTEATWPIALFHTNTLYTGQSHTRTVALPQFARGAPLRFTLVWTDPPGNPAASLKLVNDLDLIVSNNIPDGEVYVGNDIPQGSDFNTVSDPTDTNAVPSLDLVNNVENIFINRPLPGTNFTVTVSAHRVNVNAVTSQTNGVLQDYALVIACGNTLFTNALTVSDISVAPQKPDQDFRFVSALTNGVPLIHQRVGANNPLIEVLNDGVTNQWNFYVYTNTTTFTNVALLTFLSPNLSRNRIRDADLDLYASFDSKLTNLDAVVISDCINGLNGSRCARGRTGTELIIYTNAGPGSIFYLGVKAEDQEAGEFNLVAFAFNGSGRDENGNIRMIFMPQQPLEIPDGAPEEPRGTNLFALVLDPANVRRIILTNTITHENGGDLFGVLDNPASAVTHRVVLNNHRSFTNTWTFIYDDSMEGDVPYSQATDGAGSLRDFIGDPAFGLWQFTIIDNSPVHVGSIDQLVGIIEPDDLTNNLSIPLTVCGQRWKYKAIDVPFGVTNIIVSITNLMPQMPLEIYLQIYDFPTLANYVKKVTTGVDGGTLSLNLNESPGLQPGNRYYVGIYNPNADNAACVSFQFLPVQFQYSLNRIASQTYSSQNTPMTLVDDAVINSLILVTNNRAIADVKVGVRIDHPRLSDLVLHLVSPQGTRVLLTENRGGPNSTNYGYGFPVSYVLPLMFDGRATEIRTNIDTGERSGVVRVDYDFFPVPDNLRIYYDGNRIFDSGLVSGAGSVSVNYGPGVSTVVTIVMNEGGSIYPETAWTMTATVTGPWNYATFTDNPNLGGPIKFALPPYYAAVTNRTVLSNSFEDVSVTPNWTNFNQYFPGAPFRFEHWEVLTNGVAVFTDTNHPWALSFLGSTNWGTNYLALSSGRVALPLTNVVPDRDYVLTYAQRKVSSSPTQTVVVDVSASADLFLELSKTNKVFGGEAPPQWVNKVRLCPGQEILITAGTNAIGNLDQLFAGLPLNGLIGCFSFSPEYLNSNTVASAPFYIGTNALISLTNLLTPVTAPADPGGYYLYLGLNRDNFSLDPPYGDFFYSVTSCWQQCQYASGELLLGSNAVPILGSANWKVDSLQFLANPTMTNLVLKPEINTTLLFDWFQIDELVSTAYYQTEEPMTPLKGQFAPGVWKLEVWDNRTGPIKLSPSGTNDTGMLFSWDLHLIFADSPAAIPLTNGVVCSNTVRGDQIKYFVVAVPNEVTQAVNFVLSSGPGVAGVQLLYSPFGLPTGVTPPDPLPPQPEGVNFAVNLRIPLGAELPRGRYYYLGVRNNDPAEVNDFIIQATFNTRIIPLDNGVRLRNRRIAPNTNSFLTLRENTTLAVATMDYYYFDIGSTDVVSATVTVLPFQTAVPFNGDVNMVLRRALPVVDLFPRPTFFEYESTHPSLENELIIVNSNSLPVQLAPGRWYVGIYNTTNALAHYDIIARWTNDSSLWKYVDLVDSVPRPFNFTDFYRFIVPNTNKGVLFQIYGFAGDAELLVRRSDLPSPDFYDFSFAQGAGFFQDPGVPELVALHTNIFIPNLSFAWEGEPAHINPTNWFLKVVSPYPYVGASFGTICAKVTDAAGLLFDCTGGPEIVDYPIPGGPFTFAFKSVPGEKYAVEQTTDLISWSSYKTITATGTKTSITTPDRDKSRARFYRIKQVP